MSARIRHIALVTDNPVETAEFYKTHFGMTELYRQPAETGENGVWLTDGYIYFAVLKYGGKDVPKLGVGQTSEMRGIHHIGFLVEDQAVKIKELADAKVKPVPGYVDEFYRPLANVSDKPNEKWLGPDEVNFDVRDGGWDEAISSRTQLYKLVPAGSK